MKPESLEIIQVIIRILRFSASLFDKLVEKHNKAV